MSVELLAPASSYESLIQNLECGADAVYVGGLLFGARHYARNLTQEQLLLAIDEAHIRGKKLYLTVNTLLKNREIGAMLYDYLLPLYEQGLDAVIVQDMGVLQMIRREFPGLAIHASTQMTVTGVQSAIFLEKQQVRRIVTARELSLSELREIHSCTSLDIEVFVHGAMCYSYSGQCLMSSFLGGRSGNRGRCAQPCRLPYEVAGNERRNRRGSLHPLSMRDLNALELLPEILDAGVTSLKIEGRMKQAVYTAGVVSVYRKYLDLCERNPDGYRVLAADQEYLYSLFQRGGFCQGYFRQKSGPEMIAFRTEKKIGEPAPQPVGRKEKLRGHLILRVDEPACLSLTFGDKTVVAVGDVVSSARNQPVSEEYLSSQLGKLGNTPYELEELTMDISQDIFLPASSVNRLRREAVRLLGEKLSSACRRQKPDGYRGMSAVAKPAHSASGGTPVLTASCETMEQARVLLACREIRVIYCSWEWIQEVLEINTDRDIWLMLPHVTRNADWGILQPMIESAMERGCAGILARSLESACWLLNHGYAEVTVLDHHVYTYNDESVAFWRSQGFLRMTAPLELNSRELGERDNFQGEFVIYGYLPMMVSAQCLRKNSGGCRKGEAQMALKDRYSSEFKVKCYCDFCYNVIYNTVPYGLFRDLALVEKLGFACLRMSFTVESAQQTADVVDMLRKSRNHRRPACKDGWTRGHFKRGVE